MMLSVQILFSNVTGNITVTVCGDIFLVPVQGIFNHRTTRFLAWVGAAVLPLFPSPLLVLLVLLLPVLLLFVAVMHVVFEFVVVVVLVRFRI